MDMVIYPGDPLTPGVGATENATRIASHNEAPNLLKIPVLPISYHDAQPLLEALEGPVAPDDWRGALPFTYHIGPGKTMVHLKLEFDWKLVPCHDVIATIKGSKYPDQSFAGTSSERYQKTLWQLLGFRTVSGFL